MSPYAVGYSHARAQNRLTTAFEIVILLFLLMMLMVSLLLIMILMMMMMMMMMMMVMKMIMMFPFQASAISETFCIKWMTVYDYSDS